MEQPNNFCMASYHNENTRHVLPSTRSEFIILWVHFLCHTWKENKEEFIYCMPSKYLFILLTCLWRKAAWSCKNQLMYVNKYKYQYESAAFLPLAETIYICKDFDRRNTTLESVDRSSWLCMHTLTQTHKVCHTGMYSASPAASEQLRTYISLSVYTV